MKSYFFFGFHIIKDFTVTFMCQIRPKTRLDSIKNKLYSFYFKSDKILKNFYKGYIFNVIYLEIFNNQKFLFLFDFRKVEFIA